MGERSLGRCSTAAFTCEAASAGLVLLAVLLVVLEADWLLPSFASTGFCTRESVRNPPLV